MSASSICPIQIGFPAIVVPQQRAFAAAVPDHHQNDQSDASARTDRDINIGWGCRQNASRPVLSIMMTVSGAMRLTAAMVGISCTSMVIEPGDSKCDFRVRLNMLRDIAPMAGRTSCRHAVAEILCRNHGWVRRAQPLVIRMVAHNNECQNGVGDRRRAAGRNAHPAPPSVHTHGFWSEKWVSVHSVRKIIPPLARLRVACFWPRRLSEHQ